MCARLLVLTRVRISERQHVGILIVAGLDLRSPLQIRQRFLRLSLVDQKFSHAVIGIEVFRFALCGRAERGFRRINRCTRPWRKAAGRWLVPETLSDAMSLASDSLVRTIVFEPCPPRLVPSVTPATVNCGSSKNSGARWPGEVACAGEALEDSSVRSSLFASFAPMTQGPSAVWPNPAISTRNI